MPKVRPEKIAGIVALSYLVLIPAGGFLMYRKIQQLDQDLNVVWDKAGLDETGKAPLIDVSKIMAGFRR